MVRSKVFSCVACPLAVFPVGDGFVYAAIHRAANAVPAVRQVDGAVWFLIDQIGGPDLVVLGPGGIVEGSCIVEGAGSGVVGPQVGNLHVKPFRFQVGVQPVGKLLQVARVIIFFRQEKAAAFQVGKVQLPVFLGLSL